MKLRFGEINIGDDFKYAGNTLTKLDAYNAVTKVSRGKQNFMFFKHDIVHVDTISTMQPTISPEETFLTLKMSGLRQFDIPSQNYIHLYHPYLQLRLETDKCIPEAVLLFNGKEVKRVAVFKTCSWNIQTPKFKVEDTVFESLSISYNPLTTMISASVLNHKGAVTDCKLPQDWWKSQVDFIFSFDLSTSPLSITIFYN